MDCIDKFPVQGGPVFKVVGLVHDENVILPGRDNIEIVLGLCLVDRGKNKRSFPEIDALFLKSGSSVEGMSRPNFEFISSFH